MGHSIKTTDLSLRGKSKRVGLFGASGCGKTTIARYIQGFGIPFLEASASKSFTHEDVEKFEQILNQKFVFSHQNTIKWSHQFPEFGYQFQWAVAKYRSAAIKNNSHFVMDRTPLDVYVYWLLQCGPYVTDQDTLEFLQFNLEAWKELTHVIYVSNTNQPPIIENDGVRIPNYLYQRVIDNIFYMQFDTHFRKHSPNTEYNALFTWDLSARKNLVAEFLGFDRNTINIK